MKKSVGVFLAALLLAGAGSAAEAAPPDGLLPGEETVAEQSADVTGDGVADRVCLVGKRGGQSGFIRDANLMAVDGATGEIARSSFGGLSGYYGALEIGDFNGDKIADALFTLRAGSRAVCTYVVAFHTETPTVIFRSADDAAAEARSGEVVITPDDDGSVVRVVQGSVIQLRLPENASTGYTWQFLRSTGGENVDFIGQQSLVPDGAPEMAGRPGLRVFSFRARRAGKVEMQLANYRVWEGEGAAVDHFQTTVEIVE